MTKFGRRLVAAMADSTPAFNGQQTVTAPPSQQIADEVSSLRRGYVEGQVTRKIDFRNGDATAEQINQWEAEAYKRWDEMYPSLAALVAALVVEGGQS